MALTLDNQIINQLLYRSSDGNDVGLLHGKMGLILFFAFLFKHTNCQIYNDTAEELMDELRKVIHNELPVGFSKGLSGIGWGVEYLIQNGFINDDSLDTCEDIDKRIMEKDPRRITDYSFDTGLEGLLHYVLAHIKGVMLQRSQIPFDETYLFDLYQTVLEIQQDVELSDGFKRISSDYKIFYKNRDTIDYSLKLSTFIDDIRIRKNNNLLDFPLGLKNGLSGYLFKRLNINLL